MRKFLVKLSITSLLLSTLVPINAYAHKSPNTCHPNGESSGYSVDCNNQQGSSSFTYNLQNVDSTYAGYVSNGASRWNTTGVVNITKTNTESTNGRVIKYTDPNTSTIAYFGNYYSDVNGHLYAWTLGMNTSIMSSRTAAQNSHALTHELGHAIGLNDLYSDNNQGKLMYGYSTSTASFPTSRDIAGATEAINGS
ncbi:hypothetical protein MKX40_23225 [Paenibacillus sp. FSL R5-0517]|uniref:hypothetical protein n=1 Tax=Paenibacillus sp. FSL R5-0517 TaxID=2921647 RepID=UPI0030DA21CC